MQRARERGSILVAVIMVVALAIAALAAISSGRVVAESKTQTVLEDEGKAFREAYGQLHLAMNVVNNSAYNEDNQNLELKAAMDGDHGGTVAGDPDTSEPWMADPSGIQHGKVRTTDVRVYRGREYIPRLATLKGETPTEVDTEARSSRYFVLEAAGRSGDVVRVVSALVRENEPFSSFVFFQNRHPLGISGAPRGLIHANDEVAFYFPDGNYVDSVSAVNGFNYESGATESNTNLATANPEATEITLEQVDFAELQTKANLFAGTPGLDAEIKLYADGRARIKQYTPPHYEDVEYSWTGDVLVGWETRTVTELQDVQVGTVQEERTRDIIVGYETETYTVDVPVYEDQDVEMSREDPVYEEQEVERTRQVPIYETQTVTCTRWVEIFVPYNNDPGGGTAVGGDGGVPGEWEWVEEEYECEQEVLIGYDTETYTETEWVQVGTETVTWTETVQVQVGTVQEERTRQVPIYEEETYTVDVPVYEEQEVEVEDDFPIYEEQTYTWTENEFFRPELVDTTYVMVKDNPGTIFIDGRVTRLYGDLNGRLSIVGNEKVRITDSIRYVDDDGDTAMLNGDDYTQPYERNSDYDGNSVLGVIAREDILFSDRMPTAAEINGTLLAAEGRVGIAGFQIDANGEPVKDPYYGLTAEELEREQAYDRTSYDNDDFRKESLRRLGGIISNDRILETYIVPRSDGTASVDSGFKRGNMRFDINLMFNPPPNFVEVPRPVVTSVAPIYFVRDDDS